MRECPQCEEKLGMGMVTAYTNGMDCPKCGARLEVAEGSRYVAMAIGVAAGVGVWWLTKGGGGGLGWAMGMVYAFLTMSVVGAGLLGVLAELKVGEREPEVVVEAAGHGGHH